MGVHDDIGPQVSQSRALVHGQAVRLRTLAAMASDYSTQGPQENLPAAMRALDAMRAILGEGRAND